MKRIDLENPTELEKAFSVLKQLRSHLNFESYLVIINKLKKESYELWAWEDEGKIVGLMGLRPYTDFVRDTHYFIDDFVVEEASRSKGIGAKMLKFAESYCAKRQLPSMRLCCAHENKNGYKFYTREAWIDRSCAFVKKI